MSRDRKVSKGQTGFHTSAESKTWEKFNAYLKFSEKKKEDVLPGLVTEVLKDYLADQTGGEKS
jgi:hypothetical protein